MVAVADRMKGYLGLDEFVKMVDFEGNYSFFKIARTEPMGLVLVEFANATNTLASAADTGSFAGFDYLQPARQNRLYQVRTMIVAIDQGSGKWLDSAEIGARVDLEVEHPSGTRRFGTATRQSGLTLNTISNTVGGVSGGRVPPYMVPVSDMPSEVYDLWVIYGVYPAFRVSNNNEAGLPALGDDGYDYYIATFGMKYLVLDVSPEELDLLTAHELEYRGVTIGGVPTSTTRA